MNNFRLLSLNEKELCFKIENKNLYLEEILIEFECVPILFLCSNKEEFYLALCTDIDNLTYIVVKLFLSEVHKLLHGKIAIRKVFLNQKEYWYISSNDNINNDCIEKNNMNKMDLSVLPKEDVIFEAYTKKIKEFIKEFDNIFINHNN